MVPGIDRLRDIQGLDPVSWWPPAIGWWLVAAAVVILILAVAWWRRQRLRYPLGSWQKDASRQLRRLRHQSREWEPKRVASELSELLRRIAMARYGRESCAGLAGEEWLEWLGEKDPSGFDWRNEGHLLLELPYAPALTQDRSQALQQLIDASLRWVFAKPESNHV